MAAQENFLFLSSDKKNMIHAVRWIPERGEIKAILQITHGMVEYIERYEGFAEFLTKQGFLVTGHDHLGHGQSVSTKADLGYIQERNGSDFLIEDMHTLRRRIQKEYPDKPYFMLGHSMGSYMLRKYLTIHGDNLAGALIVGTGAAPDSVTKPGIALCKIIAKFRGWRYRSTFVQNITYGKPYKQFCLDGSIPENSWLTKDTEIVKKYYADPYCTFMFTLAAYRCLFEAVLYDNQLENTKKIPKNLPLILLSGEQDPVGDLGEGVKTVYEQFKTAGMKNVRYKLYKDDRHEILNETDKEQIYKDILTWCQEQLP